MFNFFKKTEAPKTDVYVHILMPAFNAAPFIKATLESVFSQTYPKLRLLIIDDGSTDDTVLLIKEFGEELELADKLCFKLADKNSGVAKTRQDLILWSRELDPGAYIFWLDADDQYSDKDFIAAVIKQMELTQADLCLLNFSIKYEDESQEVNAQGLKDEKAKMLEIMDAVLAFSGQVASPLDFEVMDFTSLGWAKAYGPTIKFPVAEEMAFEDFAYMAVLLDVHKITVLPSKQEGIEYLRRSTSICGQRRKVHFTEAIPRQLEKFFNTVVLNSETDNLSEQSQKLAKAHGFVLRKLEQYQLTLETLVQQGLNNEINEEVVLIYQEKSASLKEQLNQKIEQLAKKTGIGCISF